MRGNRIGRVLGVGVLAVLLGLSGCAGARYRPGEAIAAPEFASRGLSGREYPREFEAAQRVTVEVAGKVFHFTAYLQVRRGEGLRGVALGEMGVKVFELRREKGVNEVLSKPKTMPTKPLLDGVVEDLWHLYGECDALGGWVQRPDAAGAVGRRRDGGIDEYQYGAGDGRLVRSWRVAGDRIRSVAEYGATEKVPGWDKELPARIDVQNRRWGYRMTIRLLSIKPIGAGDAAAGQREP